MTDASPLELTYWQRHPIQKQTLDDAVQLSWQQIGVPALGAVAGLTVTIMNEYNAGRLKSLTDVKPLLSSLLYSLAIALALYILVAVVRAPFIVAGRQNRELVGLGKRVNDLEQKPEQVPLTPVSMFEIEQAMERFMAQHYDIKKLEPNFVDMGDEYVEAYNDDKGVIVRGSSHDKDNAFHALVRSFGNEHPRDKVRSLQRVSFRLNFICFDRATRNEATAINIHRGAWLTEAEIEIDFPAHCPPRRAVIVTAEGADNRVYAVRRDSDSTYKSILPLREELTGSIYKVFVTLLVESRNSKNFQYFLEITREPSIQIRLTNAAIWTSGHLQKFVREGITFSERLHEIWKAVQDKFPTPPTKPRTHFLLAPMEADKFDYAENSARIRAAELEQEQKMVDEIKDWEERAHDWVDLFFGAEQSDKIFQSKPSVEDGLNRVSKPLSHSFQMVRPEVPPAPPRLPYWTLSDAVSTRIDHLMKIL
jgi:hypothetical protein